MLIALTGTPGTGKTSVAKILQKEYQVVYLKDYEDAVIYYDEHRDSKVVDLDTLREEVNALNKDALYIIEGHYAHEMPVDVVIVLRCHPEELGKRLKKREYKERKIQENVEAEAMSLITSESILYHGKDKVFEIDTTGKTPEECAKEVEDILNGQKEKYRPRINYSEEILKWY